MNSECELPALGQRNGSEGFPIRQGCCPCTDNFGSTVSLHWVGVRIDKSSSGVHSLTGGRQVLGSWWWVCALGASSGTGDQVGLDPDCVWPAGGTGAGAHTQTGPQVVLWNPPPGLGRWLLCPVEGAGPGCHGLLGSEAEKPCVPETEEVTALLGTGLPAAPSTSGSLAQGTVIPQVVPVCTNAIREGRT